MNKVKRMVSVLLLMTGCCGCTAVAPWQRGTLAKPQMALEPNPLQTTLRAHIYGSREAASGVAGSTGGGGCGCY